MSAFERLDPLVQHHIVNTLGWRELRSLQEASIDPILSGHHCLLLAPTAGGKTESAVFPLLSRMCTHRWPAPSVIYVCPLKALINNLGERLERYARMVGRALSVWHGDVNQSARQHTRANPADLLLTTPESLESMLISANSSMRSHLKNVRAVVVDEIHAFAGDDRGWHLLCLLDRLAHIAGRDLQRVGLSATVGNAEQLLAWFVADSTNPRTVVQPPVPDGARVEVMVDYVGSLQNAATVISRLHHGEKRLVFCDSRSRVETLAGFLRTAGVETCVSHSSLSAIERRRSEEAFARGSDCVIVATSTLELGVDVGDLDRVIQIDAPVQVASFLQRLGRTGRRPGKPRNCLFLATNEDALLQSVGLLGLWQRGFVEPIMPPRFPYHIIAQQALALCLQNGGLGRKELVTQLGRLPPARTIPGEALPKLLDHLVSEGLLASDGTRYFMGETGERTFGRRHFLELVSVFTSAPVLSVTDGRHELGSVDQNLFLTGDAAEGRLLSLGGRGWRVTQVDWKERRVQVTPSDVGGKTVWFGASRGLSFALCRAIRQALSEEGESHQWSQRARERMRQLRAKFSFIRDSETTVVQQAGGGCVWYSFAGEAVNSTLNGALNRGGIPTESVNEYGIEFGSRPAHQPFEQMMRTLTAEAVRQTMIVNKEAERMLKFAECVPADLRYELIRARRCSLAELKTLLDEPRRWLNVCSVD